MRSARVLVASVTAAALSAASCGQSDDRDTVRVTTQRFLSAFSARDGEKACAALSQDTRKELESQESKSCPDAIGQVELTPGAVTRVHVTLTSAKVDLASRETILSAGAGPASTTTGLDARSDGAF